MKPPIIIVEGKSIYIFNSATDAQEFMEPIDVDNNEYKVFDKHGYLLNVKIDYIKHQSKFLWFSRQVWREAVIIEDIVPPILRNEELSKILSTYLSNHDFPDDWLSNASLDELVVKVSEIHGL
jgi:hypothetical protein